MFLDYNNPKITDLQSALSTPQNTSPRLSREIENMFVASGSLNDHEARYARFRKARFLYQLVTNHNIPYAIF